MHRLRVRTRVVRLLMLVPPLVAPAAAYADEAADLQRAVQLFNDGDYHSAQAVLLGIDRSKLKPDQQSLRDDYLNRAQVALQMSDKALRDLEDAETAMKEGEADRARGLLEAVLANEYAKDALRKSAAAQLRDLDAGKIGADAPPAARPPNAAPPDQPPPSPAAQPPVASPKVNGQRTRALVEEGDRLVGAARYEEARKRYDEALVITPGHPEALAGLKRVEEHQRNVTGERTETLLDRIRREDQINWQRTVAEYRDLERIIRDHVSNERMDEAVQLLPRGRQIVEAGKQFADPISKYESLYAEMEALEEYVRNQERSFHERKVSEVRREIEGQRKKQLQEIEERRQQQVEALMAQAQQHRKDGDLDAAISTLKQVVVIDPKNKPARWMMDALDDLRHYEVANRTRQDFYDQTRRTLHQVEESKIPWYELLRYPDNWAEVIARPERNLGGRSKRDGQLLGALNQQVPADFLGVPFDQVLERLADVHRLNIIVNWNDLLRAGVQRNAPIELSLPQEISLKRVLTEVLEQAGGGGTEVGFEVHEGSVKIATRDTLDRMTYTSVYDINDLLMEIPMFNDSPMTDLTEANQRGVPRAVQRSEQPWRVGDDDDDEAEDEPEQSSRARKIIDLIQETIAPESWRDRGGTIGTIKEINGQLVITQNSASQRQVANLLGKLREQRAIQIAVEARFITVTSNYLEELGIDLDIVLNSGNAGLDFVPNPAGSGVFTDPVLGNALLLPRTFSRLGFTPAVPALGVPLAPSPATLTQPYGQTQLIPQRTGGTGSESTPVPIVNRVTNFTDPSGLGSDVPGSFLGQQIGPAFGMFGSFLDNIQVDFVIRATQADSRSTVLTAPRLVLFNGQRSWVAVTIQQNFVSQLIPVVATGAVAQAPQVGTIDSGAVLDVQATVTADKRYVTMTLRPGVTRLLDLQTIPFSGGGAGGGIGGGGAANQAFIQLPQLSSQRVQTTVMVPDGGTLLIGGQKLATETEVEAGVPILSKIPILKRLYSSRTMGKDEQTLLILIKPQILIQTEQEELAFPSFKAAQP